MESYSVIFKIVDVLCGDSLRLYKYVFPHHIFINLFWCGFMISHFIHCFAIHRHHYCIVHVVSNVTSESNSKLALMLFHMTTSFLSNALSLAQDVPASPCNFPAPDMILPFPPGAYYERLWFSLS